MHFKDFCDLETEIFLLFYVAILSRESTRFYAFLSHLSFVLLCVKRNKQLAASKRGQQTHREPNGNGKIFNENSNTCTNVLFFGAQSKMFLSLTFKRVTYRSFSCSLSNSSVCDTKFLLLLIKLLS